jgi:hypothetical protein
MLTADPQNDFIYHNIYYATNWYYDTSVLIPVFARSCGGFRPRPRPAGALP